MGVAADMDRKSMRLARLLGATALACVFSAAIVPAPSFAQTVADIAPDIPAGTEMFLEADTLIYDNNDDSVTASGGVRIDYGGNKLVASQVTYDRRSRRLIASGNVELVEKDGTKVYSDKIDITDDFGTGFVNALRVETVDETYFAAESAERRDGFLTTFNNGVYTACEPCEEQPDKAPVWRLKAKRIIWNSKAKTVRFEHAAFEFLGVPLGNLAAFEIADPTVKRKSGFPDPEPQLRQPSRCGTVGSLLSCSGADLRPDADRHRIHQPGFPGRGRMAPAFQQRPVQHPFRRHQPGRPGRLRLRHRRSRPSRRSEPVCAA